MTDSFELLEIQPFEDYRGQLKKILTKSMLKDEQEIQEVYVLFSNKDAVRGNHYHKRTTEYFTVLSGEALMVFADSDLNDVVYVNIKAEDNVSVKVNPCTIHAFKNESEEPLVMLAVSLKEYSETDTDTYSKIVI